jgi:hypothetical protein
MSTPAPSPCPCDGPQGPRVVLNPAGQPFIADRVDDFTGLRRALLRPLPGEESLGMWAPVPGDLGLAVLEWWAYLGDVLTFYNERIANESYLRTATFPESVAGLVALLGYQPAPGLAATGQVGAIRSTSHRAEPVVIPAGMQLSSTASAGIPPQTFEVAARASFPGPSDIPVRLLADTALGVDASSGDPTSVLLGGKVTGVKADDRLLLVKRTWDGTDDTDWAYVTAGSVTPQLDPGTGATNSLFSLSGAWGSVAPPAPAGSAASAEARVEMRIEVRSPPRYESPFPWWMPLEPPATPPERTATDFRLLRPTAAAALWSQAGPPSEVIAAGAVSGQVTVHLSAAVRAIQPGDLVLFDGGSQAAPSLGLVLKSTEVLWSVPFPPGSSQSSPSPAPGIVVTHTQLTLATPDYGTLTGYQPDDLAAISVRYGFRDLGTVVPAPATQVPSLPVTVALPGGFELPEGTTTALLEDATGSGVAVAVSGAGNAMVTLSGLPPQAGEAFNPPLAVPLRLLVDVLAVSRGTTVAAETLGSGNATRSNQSFTLAKSPLTYLAVGAGWASTLRVFVAGIAWSEASSFFGQPPGAQVYVVTRLPDLSTQVRFGDGVNGSRLPTGSGNVVAHYRYGSGALSPPAGRLTSILKSQPNLSAIHNPVAVSGGRDPQAPADVKANAPASVFTFGRAISAIDYEVVAGQAAGVSRARAYWTFDPAQQRTLVKVYVNDDPGAVSAATAALAGAEDPNRPVRVMGATGIPLSISCTLVVSADRVPGDVATAATAALADPVTGLFSPAAMGIGAFLYRSQIDAALSVPGVLGVHHLTVVWDLGWLLRRLGDVFDPGEGAYFELLAIPNVTAVSVNG